MANLYLGNTPVYGINVSYAETIDYSQACIVTFKNDNGAVLDSQIIRNSYGVADPITRARNPIPIPTKHPEADGTEYIFTGWDKDLTVITEDTEVQAKFDAVSLPSVVTPFANCTWAQIKAVADRGVKNNDSWEIGGVKWWSVGDEKTITLSTGEEITLQIWDFSHDEKSGGGLSGLTIGMKNLMAERRVMNETDAIWGEWDECSMREYLNADVFSTLPIDLQLCIVDSVKYFDGNGVLDSSIDKLFLPSYTELGHTITDMSEGKLYQIYTAEDSSRIKSLANGTGVPSIWWTRSRTFKYTRNYRCINEQGGTGWSYGFEALFGICFAFCI